MEWRTIDSAPKDGTSIITVVKGYLPAITEYRTFDGVSRFCIDPETFMSDDHFHEYFFDVLYAPTHWMPLPDGPL